MHGKSPSITTDPKIFTKLKKIERFGDANRVKTSHFYTITLKFSAQLDHTFSHVFLFGNMFPDCHGFVAMPVTSCIKDTCSNSSISI